MYGRSFRMHSLPGVFLTSRLQQSGLGGSDVALGEELLMKVHQACVTRLFERNDLVLDAFGVL